MDVVPLNVNGLEVNIEVELATKFPFRSMAKVLELNEPLVSVRMPLMVIACINVKAAPPVLVTFLNCVVNEGISAPVETLVAIS